MANLCVDATYAGGVAHEYHVTKAGPRLIVNPGARCVKLGGAWKQRALDLWTGIGLQVRRVDGVPLYSLRGATGACCRAVPEAGVRSMGSTCAWCVTAPREIAKLVISLVGTQAQRRRAAGGTVHASDSPSTTMAQWSGLVRLAHTHTHTHTHMGWKVQHAVRTL